MRIFIDIGHPAHVHYFRNFIKIMELKGHAFLVSSRKKECTFELLESYGISYFSRGSGRNSSLGKIIYLFKANWILYKLARRFKPDIFLSMASPYAAQVSWLIGQPHITFDDTEHAEIARKFYKSFSQVIFTPFSFSKDLGPKQIRFNSYMELFYLHPTYFLPNNSIFSTLDLADNKSYVVLRFISWNASHDIGQNGLDLETKRRLVVKLEAKYKVLISAEGELPEDLKKYRIKIPAYKIHDVLAQACLFIGESATMAQESALLGTPAIYVSSLNAGTLDELEKDGLIFGFRSSLGVMEKIDELINNKNLKKDFKLRKQKTLDSLIDPTKMLVEYIEEYDRVRNEG